MVESDRFHIEMDWIDAERRERRFSIVIMEKTQEFYTSRTVRISSKPYLISYRIECGMLSSASN